MLEEALKAAKRGWYVFPVNGGGKFPPLIKDWENAASNDENQIRAWAKKFSGCNWGLAAGRSDLCIIDVDVRDLKVGMTSLKILEEACGKIRGTLTARTPSGGWHFYFKGAVQSCTNRLGQDIDVKSRGGYVLLPGSKTTEGEYQWANF